MGFANVDYMPTKLVPTLYRQDRLGRLVPDFDEHQHAVDGHRSLSVRTAGEATGPSSAS